MKEKRKIKNSYVSYLGFFCLIAATVTVAMFMFSFVSEESQGDKLVISAVMLLVIIFLALVCTALDIFRHHYTTQEPLEKILDATDRIASGDFSVRLEETHGQRYNAFDCIIENINRMAAELSKTEVLHNDFISNVSHELKTPLAVIQNYTSLLQKDGISEEDRKKYSLVLLQTVKRLNDLITNILRLNKLENQQIRPESEKIRLDEELAQAVLRYEEVIESKKITVTCDLEEITVYSSASLLELVWNNLLSNAFKFTPEGGTVGVTLKKEQKKVIIQVSDTGMGISEETGKHIFEKFYQGDTSHAAEGNGLGLALVKKVIDIIGGEIRAESEMGKGTVFTVILKAGIV